MGRMILRQLQARQLPHLCDSIGEVLEASVGGGCLRGRSALNGVRDNHDRRITWSGSPDQCWVKARLGIHDARMSPLPPVVA